MSITNRLDGLASGAAIKVPCDVATLAAITLSGEQSIDGVTTSGSRVLVKNQADSTENGIYVSDTGDWARAKDFDGSLDVVKGTLVTVTGGTTNADTVWRVTTANDVVVGTSSITWEQGVWGDSSTLTFTAAGANAVQRTMQSKARDIISVVDDGATGDGVTNDRTFLNNSQTDYAGKTLWFPPGTYLVNSNLTLAGVDLAFAKGAKIKPALGVTITITGSVSAGAYQIFDLSVGGHVDLRGADIKATPIEWYGVVGGDVAWSNANATANEPLIDEALLYASFEIQFKTPGLYSTTGHTITAAHKFTGLGISDTNAIYGDGKVFSDNAFMVSQGALLAGLKYVFQNGAGSECPIFEDISVIGDPADCVALGVMASSTAVLNWQCHAFRCKFKGYIGQHLAWANWNTWEACFIQGVRAPCAHTSWNDSTLGGSACYVQKQNYVGCLFSQTQQVSGNIFLQNRDGDATPGSLAISNNSFLNCDFEGGFNGLYLMGREQNFVACHLENMLGTYWVSGEASTYDSLWQNPSCNTGAGSLTGDLSELIQDIGTRSSVYPYASAEVMSLTGCTTVPTSNVKYTIVPGPIKFVHLDIQVVGGTSNATTKTLTTLPVPLRPSGDRVGLMQIIDNGGSYVLGSCIVKSTGVIELYASAAFGAWTASGACTIQNFSITYSLV